MVTTIDKGAKIDKISTNRPTKKNPTHHCFECLLRGQFCCCDVIVYITVAERVLFPFWKEKERFCFFG